VRFRIEWWLSQIVSACVRVLPIPAVRACGSALGHVAYDIDRFHRRIALTNLASAFPTRPPAERRAIARAMFTHFGRLVFELIKFGTMSNEQILARTEVDGEERVRHA
jgi:KDO2-lipid IV(A) lauroyltransferase